MKYAAMMIWGLGLGVVMLAAGCCSGHKDIANPGQIDLDAAMSQVQEALSKTAERAATQPTAGLVPAEVTVVLNVGVTKETNQSAKLTVGGVGWVPVTAGGELSASNKDTSNRSNTITLKFQSIYFAGKDSLLATKTPAELKAIIDYLKNNSIIFITPLVK